MQIEPPKNCPSCQSLLVWVKDQLYCRNVECPAKTSKQVEHFAKTLKIKGLGPNTIEKLELTTIPEIYEMPLEYLVLTLGSERVSVKLLEEIEKSKNQPLDTILPAFGIPLIGKSATEKLSKFAEGVWDLNVYTAKEAGLGPKATESLVNWVINDLPDLIDLPFSWEFSKDTRPTSERGVVCITGKLKSYPTKAAAKAVLESLGYQVKDSITKDVTILVNESGIETLKTKKAADDGVRIVNNLKNLTENN